MKINAVLYSVHKYPKYPRKSVIENEPCNVDEKAVLKKDSHKGVIVPKIFEVFWSMKVISSEQMQCIENCIISFV